MADQFELISQLGRGGMGVVWKAREVATGQVVALKLLHDLYAGDAEYVARFEREVELGRRVDSPNVVKVLGFGRRDGVPFLAMEYVDGPSLKEKLKQHGPYTWAEAKPLLLQVANGLAAAHAAGIVHRDVKPSNILLAPDGTAKLADFGIARGGSDMTRLTGTSALMGTPPYMAPEGQRDERSDLYSLGCVAYEMLVGRPPFDGDTPQQIWAAQTTGSADLAAIDDGAAGKVIAWMLATKPSDRPQSAPALVAVLEGSSKMPFSPSYWQRPARGPRLNTMLRLAATFVVANFVANLGLAAVAGGVAAFAVRRSSGSGPQPFAALTSATVVTRTAPPPTLVPTPKSTPTATATSSVLPDSVSFYGYAVTETSLTVEATYIYNRTSDSCGGAYFRLGNEDAYFRYRVGTSSSGPCPSTSGYAMGSVTLLYVSEDNTCSSPLTVTVPSVTTTIQLVDDSEPPRVLASSAQFSLPSVTFRQVRPLEDWPAC